MWELAASSSPVWELAATRSAGSVTSLLRFGDAVLAATPAGVRRSRDNGHTWSPLGPLLTPPLELLVAGAGRLWAGNAEGLYGSDDGGASWRAVLVGSRVLAIAPITDDLVLVGTEDDGVLRSEDGGRTWKSGNAGLQDLAVVGLAARGEVAKSVPSGANAAFSTGFVVYAATPTGIFRSRNGGRAWRAVDSFPAACAPQCLALSRGCVLVGTEQHGLLVSADDGLSWRSELSDRSVVAVAADQHRTAATDSGIALSEDTAAATDVGIAVSEDVVPVAANERRIVAATDIGVAVSEDDATTWHLTPTSHPVLCVAFAPDGSLLAGHARQGVLHSIDARRWQPANDGLDANLVVALAATDQRLYLAGLEDGIEVSSDAGATWSPSWKGDEQSAVLSASSNGEGESAVGATQSAVWNSEGESAAGATPSASWNDGEFAAFALSVDAAYAATSHGTLQRRDTTWQAIHPAPSRAVSWFGRSVVALTLADELLLSADAGATWRTLAPPETPTCLTFGVDGALLLGSATGVWRWQTTWQRVLDLPNVRAIALAATGELLLGGDDEFVYGVRRTRLPGRVTAIATGHHLAAVATADQVAGVATADQVAGVATADQVAVATTAGLWLFESTHSTLHLEGKPIVAVAVSESHVYAAELGGRIWRGTLT